MIDVVAALLAGLVVLAPLGQASGTRAGAPGAPAVPLVADSSEVPAIEHDAQPPPLDGTWPRRIRNVDPVWPSPATELWRFRLHIVVDATGRVATARIVQTLVGDPAARPVGPEGHVTPAVRETPSARAGLAVLAAVRQWRFEPPSPAPMLILTDVGLDAAADAGATARAAVQPRKVGGDIPPPRKLKDVAPVYPPDAIASRITGTVTIEARIGPTGEVEDARVLSGVPMLDDAALAAVRQWLYTPTVVDGVAVPVLMTVTVRFSLSR